MKTLITASLIAFASLGAVSVQAAGDHAGDAEGGQAGGVGDHKTGRRFIAGCRARQSQHEGQAGEQQKHAGARDDAQTPCFVEAH